MAAPRPREEEEDEEEEEEDEYVFCFLFLAAIAALCWIRVDKASSPLIIKTLSPSKSPSSLYSARPFQSLY